MSGRDKRETRGRPTGRQSGAYPRVTASLSVNLAAEDRRAGATLRSGAIGGCPPLEPAKQCAQRRSPGELGPAGEPRANAPRATPRVAASSAGDDSRAAMPAGAANGAGGAERRKVVTALSPAPHSVAGLPGMSVFLGELGSPAKGEAATPAAQPAALLLARAPRAVPSLADVSVSIGGDPARGRGSSRLAAPFRALLRKRDSRVTAAPPASRLAATPAPAVPSETPGVVAPQRPTVESAAPLNTASPSRPSRLRRASRYIVNGILDVTIRRFRAGTPRGGNPRRG